MSGKINPFVMVCYHGYIIPFFIFSSGIMPSLTYDLDVIMYLYQAIAWLDLQFQLTRLIVFLYNLGLVNHRTGC